MTFKSLFICIVILGISDHALIAQAWSSTLVPNAEKASIDSRLLLQNNASTDELLNEYIKNLALKDQVNKLPKGNPSHGILFELGKQLFFSKSLSMQHDVACASCHHPLLGGGDGLSLSVGVNAKDSDIVGPGREHDGDRNVDPRADGGPNVPRNASSIFNTHLLTKAVFWDGRVEVYDGGSAKNTDKKTFRTPDSLMNFADSDVGNDLIQAQARFPLTSIHEMFGHGPHKLASNAQKRQLIIDRLASDETDIEINPWLSMFQQAFNDNRRDPKQVINLERVTKALAFYQTSLVLVDNPWFDYIRGNTQAISAEAKQGALLFFAAPQEGGYGCVNCHSGNGFSDENFYNISTPQIGRGKDQLGNDHGRLLHTSQIQDKFKFRTPSLLNVQVTGPWSHAGAYSDLKQMIQHHFDPASSLENYDYSLQHLFQFNQSVEDAERARALSNASLAAFKQSETSKMLLNSNQPAKDAYLIEQFLFTLSDPCIKNEKCIQKWLPSSDETGPDGRLLQAQFSDFNQEFAAYSDVVYQPAIFQPKKTNKARTWFTDVSESSGLDYPLEPPGFSDEYHLMGGGVTVDDFNGDGWMDLFVSHAMQPGKLFTNQQDGTFLDVTEQLMVRLDSRQLGALFFDYDDDGDKDLLLVEDDINYGYFRLYMQLSNGKFVQSLSKAGISFKRFTHSLSAGDYDGDGDLDLFASHWGDVVTPVRSGYLWNNSGGGMFHDVSSSLPQTKESPLYPDLDVNFVPIFSDIDMDNDPDLLIAADYLTTQILRNQDGKYVDATTSVISDENGMGSAVGDYDNDGDLDWFVSSIWNPIEQKAYKGGTTGNRLYQNNGQGQFSDVTDEAGVRKGYWGWGACFADFNNDGWLDIFHTNGMRTGQIASESQVGQFYQDPSRLFINNKDGTFTERSQEWGIRHTGQGRGISCFDYDKDGDLDILIANNGAKPTFLRNNNLENNHYLTVKLTQVGTNPDAVGAKLWLKSDQLNQLRELRLGSNYLSNDPIVAHFGLAKVEGPLWLEILWPDGHKQRIDNIKANQELVISRDDP